MWRTATIFEEVKDNHERHQRMQLRTALTCGKWSNNEEDLLCDFQREGRNMSSWNFSMVTKNEEMDLVERQTPSETEKEIVHGVRASNVGASATPGVTDPTVVCV
jgi:hypothetical protein